MYNKISKDVLEELKQEVITLENSNANEIQVFEQNLQELQDLPSIDNLDWSPDLKCIEVITMEKIPSLSSRIRKIGV